MTIYDRFLNQKLIWSRITPKRLGSSEKSNAPPFHISKTRHLWFHSNSVWHDDIISRRFSINTSSFGLIWFTSWWFESVLYHRETLVSGVFDFEFFSSRWNRMVSWLAHLIRILLICRPKLPVLCVWNNYTFKIVKWMKLLINLYLYLFLYPRYNLNLMNYDFEWTNTWLE